MLRNIAVSGEPTIKANARCLRAIMTAITPVAVPAAIGIDRNNRSIAIPLMLPAVANIAHFFCLLFIGWLSFYMACAIQTGCFGAFERTLGYRVTLNPPENQTNRKNFKRWIESNQIIDLIPKYSVIPSKDAIVCTHLFASC